MKQLRKHISVFACMAVAILAIAGVLTGTRMQVFAEETNASLVDTIQAMGVYPQPGETVTNANERIVVSTGCEVDDVEWYTQSFTQLDEDSSFVENGEYFVKVLMKAKKGYYFVDDKEKHQFSFNNSPSMVDAENSFFLDSTHYCIAGKVKCEAKFVGATITAPEFYAGDLIYCSTPVSEQGKKSWKINAPCTDKYTISIYHLVKQEGGIKPTKLSDYGDFLKEGEEYRIITQIEMKDTVKSADEKELHFFCNGMELAFDSVKKNDKIIYSVYQSFTAKKNPNGFYLTVDNPVVGTPYSAITVNKKNVIVGEQWILVDAKNTTHFWASPEALKARDVTTEQFKQELSKAGIAWLDKVKTGMLMEEREFIIFPQNGTTFDPLKPYRVYINGVQMPKASIGENGKSINVRTTKEECPFNFVMDLGVKKTQFTYDGKVHKPTPSIRLCVGEHGEPIVLEDGLVTFDIRYSKGCVNPGIYTMKVKMNVKDYPDGGGRITFKILPAKVAIIKLTNAANGVKLNWKAAKGIDGYNIYRSTNGGRFVKIGTAKVGTTTYLDRAANKNGTKYAYRVKPYKRMAGKAVESATPTAKTTYFIKKPSITSLASGTKGKVIVKYGKNDKASGYVIQYSNSSKFTAPKNVIVAKNSTVSATLSKLTSNRKYYVKIRSYKKVGTNKIYSDWSSVKSINVK